MSSLASRVVDCTRAAVTAALVALLVAGGCSSKQPVEPIVQGPQQSEGRTVSWSTDQPSRGFVRYGFELDVYDHVAYPAAAGRRDRQLRTTHSVALLDLMPGQTVYYQLGNDAPGVAPLFSNTDSLESTVGPPDDVLTSTMIHIGFGDAHLITMPTTGKRILLDSGYQSAASAVRSYLSDHGVGQIDVMWATHIHADHLGGIVGFDRDGLLDSHPPEVFLDSFNKSTTARSAYTDVLAMLSASGVDVDVVQRSASSLEDPKLSWDPEVTVTVLNSGVPDGFSPGGDDGKNINNDSIVVKFSYGDVDFIIGGDAEVEAEASILGLFDDSFLDVEYYKAQHHGLDDANSPAWIDAMQPRVAFVPITKDAWDGDGFERRTDPALGEFDDIGAHAFMIDQILVLNRERNSGDNYNITFATDGVSYEIRVEEAEQFVAKDAFRIPSCVSHETEFTSSSGDGP